MESRLRLRSEDARYDLVLWDQERRQRRAQALGQPKAYFVMFGPAFRHV